MNSNVVSIILARGGSKGIPKKNLVKFTGKPLIYWSIEQARIAGISNIYVSTDDEEIARYVKTLDANVIKRPDNLATDTSSSDDALIHAVDQIDIPNDYIVVMLQVTSPLRKSQHIIDAIQLLKFGEYDSVFSGVQIDDICVWKLDREMHSITYDFKNRLRRQDRDHLFVENGAIYCMTAEALRFSRNRLSGRIGVSVMPKWTLTEIDDLEDLRLCEILAKLYLKGK